MVAHIKCRYSISKCDNVMSNMFCDEINYDSGCFDKFDHHECGYFDDDPEDKAVNNRCKHIKWLNCEFEKTVRHYEYSEEYETFSIKGTAIDTNNIDYLEIDGRVLIGDT